MANITKTAVLRQNRRCLQSLRVSKVWSNNFRTITE